MTRDSVSWTGSVNSVPVVTGSRDKDPGAFCTPGSDSQ